MESEFGKGFAYNLGLFLAHENTNLTKYADESNWFTAAYDHLYELCVDPKYLGDKLAFRVQSFRDFCFDKKNKANQHDKEWALQEARDLLLEWDIALEIPAMKGSYE